jgi:hypothetical protein
MDFSKTTTKLRFNLLLTITAIGLIAFLFITTFIPFKNQQFSGLFPKSRSHASNIDQTPKVSLQIFSGNISRSGVVNLTGAESDLNLSWNVGQNPDSCFGQSFTPDGKDKDWDGVKDVKGGDVLLTNSFSKKGVYLYAISCANTFGDSDGDALVINVGASKNLLEPYITSLSVTSPNLKEEGATVSSILNDSVTIEWSTLNTASAYSICAALGSWPHIFTGKADLLNKQYFTLSEKKAYKYTLFCSNENSISKKTLTIYAD